MASSSSSSSDESDKKKKKKDKKKDRKEKKDKKKDKKKEQKAKKDKKSDEKEKKREAEAEGWNCERGDAVKQIVSLLELDPNIDEELSGVFSAIDSGESIRLDGLEDKQARKKLRHLLQAFRLSQLDNGQAYRSSELKVSFTSIYRKCYEKAKECMPDDAPKKEKVAKLSKEETLLMQQKAEAAARAREKYGGVVEELFGEKPEEVELDIRTGKPVSKKIFHDFGEVARRDPGDANEAEDEEFQERAKKKAKVKGPQRPGVSLDVAGGDDTESEVEAGPRGEGEERQGVDLRYVGLKTGREEWMTEAHPSMAAAFFDVPGRKQTDKYEVKRSKEEQEAFNKAFAERGASLLQRQMEGQFAEAADAQKKFRDQKFGSSDIWGMSEKEQARTGGQKAAPPAARKAFDPEKDMQNRKPMTSDEFAKLVGNSKEALSGRFGSSGVAKSFL